MIAEDIIRQKLKDKINSRDEILVKEWVDDNKALNRIEVPVKDFAQMFKEEIEAGTSLKTVDKKGLGYDDFIDECEKEGLI